MKLKTKNIQWRELIVLFFKGMFSNLSSRLLPGEDCIQAALGNLWSWWEIPNLDFQDQYFVWSLFPPRFQLVWHDVLLGFASSDLFLWRHLNAFDLGEKKWNLEFIKEVFYVNFHGKNRHLSFGAVHKWHHLLFRRSSPKGGGRVVKNLKMGASINHVDKVGGRSSNVYFTL